VRTTPGDFKYSPIGGLSAASPDLVRIEFSPIGVGIKSLVLPRHRQTVAVNAPLLELQTDRTVNVTGTPTSMTPMAALALEVQASDGKGGWAPPVFFNLAADPAGRLWDESAPGSFRAAIVDAAGVEMIALERTYHLAQGSHAVRLEQRARNVSGAPLRFRWYQLGPTDPPQDSFTYGGDKRRLRFGYLLNPQSDPSRQTVLADDFLTWRSTALGDGVPMGDTTGNPVLDAAGNQVYSYPDKTVWPNPRAQDRRYELVWLGKTSRYFGVALSPVFDTSGPADKVFRTVSTVERLVLPGSQNNEVMGLRLVSPVFDVPAGAALDLSQGLFAGPLSRPVIRREALPNAAGMPALVVYNFGGPCGPCTFGWLTSLLLSVLTFLHDHVVFDWSIAIILLVVIVRTLLHPVTRWSQIRMQRFGKQMQEMAPKQKKLQEKYAKEPQKLREETAKLWREEGVNPAGMLGCVPMFLQMPIWIALYATLFFAVELRHQPAFYGVFQAIAPTWSFLADLSSADHFFLLPKPIHVPLLSGLMGPVEGFNVLPLILGVVYYMHTKYLSPPSSTPLTPEQQMQQKMIKWMTVVLFPLFMYNAPAGLSLYFIANSTIAIFENKWIRAHITKHGLLDLEKLKTQRAGQGPGFLARLQAAAEQRAKLVEQKRAQQARGKGFRER
jgi:YidC/Oxa1 family membrane protein insertase